MERGQLRRRASASVWAAALIVHGVALVGIGWWIEHRSGALTIASEDDPDALAGGRDVAAPQLEARSIAPGDLAEVSLVNDDDLGPLLSALEGPADQAGFDRTHPAPRLDVDHPGDRPAARGGGDPTGGVDSWTGRHDPDQLRTQTWNHPLQNLLPRHRTAADTSSPESIARRERTDYGERDSHATHRAHDGAPRAQDGAPGATGAGGPSTEPERPWRDTDPRFYSGPSALLAARSSGATQAAAARPLVDRGAEATEADRRGPARDSLDSAALSSERHPMPFELTRSSAGGTAADAGVRGARERPGTSTRSLAGGTGTAGSSHDLATGAGRPALRASRQDPYLRRIYQRLDQLVEYPRELALDLEQGQLVATFELSVKDGAVSSIRLVKSSGFDEFDRELTRALGLAGPFGPVPSALRGSAAQVQVIVPYAFRTRLIR